ncbi:MAG: endonuclease/exonuclease/phosphatase family protein [Planctomycetota bacterium]
MNREKPIVKNKHWTARAAWFAIRAYAIFLPAAYLLMITTGDAVPGLALVENTIQWIGILALPVAVYFLFAHKRIWAWFFILSTTACYCYDYLNSNSGANADISELGSIERKVIDTSQQLTILSWNVGYGRATHDEIANAIKREGTDVCGLVEVPEEFPAFAKYRLSDLYPFQIFEGEGLLRKGILSKTRILESRTESLDNSRPWMFCSIKIGEKMLSIYLVHFSPWIAVLGRYSSDSHALAEIRSRIKNEPVIIMGDFNSISRSSEWKRLWHHGFRHTFRAMTGDKSYSFPVFGRYHYIPIPPILRIDAIWTKGIWTASSFIARDGGSDHLPIIADLYIP